MSMPVAVRKMNEARALEALFSKGIMSRADIARVLELTRSTASSIVASLISEGQVQEVSADDSDREQKTGRPGISLRLNPDYAFYLGADVGAKDLRLCVLDFAGTLRTEVTHRFDQPNPAPDVVSAHLAEMVQKAGADLPDQAAVKGLNVAIPGIVDLTGDILRAPPLNWRKVPFREQLAKAMGEMPVHKLINDANAFAVAQLRRPDLIDTQDAVFLLMDDGVGGCILSGGRLLEGTTGLAAEIGHMPVGTKGHCNLTGIHGAFENYVSRPAILAHYASLGGQATSLTAFLTALDQGDAAAQKVLSVWTQDFARGLAILTTLLNPARIVIGGRVAEMARRTEADLLGALREHLLEETPPPVLELTGTSGEGPAVGAAMILHHQHFAQFGPLGSGRPELLGADHSA